MFAFSKIILNKDFGKFLKTFENVLKFVREFKIYPKYFKDKI